VAEAVATDQSERDAQVAELLAENVRLKELNSVHRVQLEQANEELASTREEAQQVRAALLQSQKDIAHLLRIADEKQAILSKTEAEKDKISKEHDQACAFADSVQDEIKRLEGLLDELRKRQAMTSVVVESLTNERDERKQEVDTAKKRIMDLELEVAGFKKLCSAQKQMLQESSVELENLQRRLKIEPGQGMQQKPAISDSAEVHMILQASASDPTPSAHTASQSGKSASTTASSWAQASKGGFYLDVNAVAKRNQQADNGANGTVVYPPICSQPSSHGHDIFFFPEVLAADGMEWQRLLQELEAAVGDPSLVYKLLKNIFLKNLF
jgi:hypothetical protein